MGPRGDRMGGFRAFFPLSFSPLCHLKLHASCLQQLCALQKPHVLACCTCPLVECEHQRAAGLSSPNRKPMETAVVQGAMWEAFAEAGVLGRCKFNELEALTKLLGVELLCFGQQGLVH